MSTNIVNFEELQTLTASKSLSVQIDDFSVKVISSQDPYFWVRIQKSDEGEIIVTDFNPGSLPQLTLNIALRKAVKQLYSPTPDNITFKNVIPVKSTGAQPLPSYEGPVNTIRAACEGFARTSRKVVSSFRVVPEGRKFNVVVALS